MVKGELLRRYGELRQAQEKVFTAPIGELAVDTILYLKENGVKKQFIVVGHNTYSSGSTLVMRRFASYGTAYDDSSDYYDGSTLDIALTINYMSRFKSDTQAAIVSVPIVIAAQNSNDTKTINRTIFVFSLTELDTPATGGVTGSGLIRLGHAIPYFDSAGRRTAYSEEHPTDGVTVVTRTPYYAFGDERNRIYSCRGNYYFHGIVSMQQYYRPAFCLKSTFEVEIDEKDMP